MIKPNLYCFGDSFVTWPFPEGKHWTDLFSNEYTVHKLGNNGSSNEHIIFQLGNLPKYKPGDRVVMVFTEPMRIPKWTWGKHYGEFTATNPQNRGRKGKDSYSDYDTVKVLEEVMVRKEEALVEIITKGPEVLHTVKVKAHEKDTPLEIINFIDNIDNLLADFKPVMVTWSEQMFLLLKSKITPICQGDWTSLTQEGIREEDYHPGIEGCKHWHKVIGNLLHKKLHI